MRWRARLEVSTRRLDAGEQGKARGGAERRDRVGVQEECTLPGKAVQVGREAMHGAAQSLLAVRRKVARREVVGHHQEQVGTVAALGDRLRPRALLAVDCRRATRAARRRLAQIRRATVGGLLLGVLPKRLEMDRRFLSEGSSIGNLFGVRVV